jgi:hypothetical protein
MAVKGKRYFLHNVQTGCGFQPSLCPVGIEGAIPRGKVAVA